MKSLVFAKRCFKEIIRDPLTLFFGAAFPLILLLLLSAIQVNVPVPMFEIDTLAPGIAVFGQSFLALFSAMLISKDRASALTRRLLASPMKKADFVMGYTIPMLPLAVLQSIVCLLAGGIMGMNLRYVLLTVMALLPSALVFIGIGITVGSLLSDRQVGGICGALLTNLTAWLSGIWFDVSLVGGLFEKIANVLPFIHATRAAQAAAAGDIAGLLPHLGIVAIYAAVFCGISVFVCMRRE